jgi:hypothetical protein
MPERLGSAIVRRVEQTSIRNGGVMESIAISHVDPVEETADEEARVHAWRVEQLQRLGLQRILAEAFAERVDWHELAKLVARGCTPDLALEIAR